jgi:nucleobase:cation symporter-1, NCS1 family
MAIGTALGWGLVTSSADGFGWEGYLLGPFGLGGRSGSWAYANLGVLVALALGFLSAIPTAGRVRRQEAGENR